MKGLATYFKKVGKGDKMTLSKEAEKFVDEIYEEIRKNKEKKKPKRLPELTHSGF